MFDSGCTHFWTDDASGWEPEEFEAPVPEGWVVLKETLADPVEVLRGHGVDQIRSSWIEQTEVCYSSGLSITLDSDADGPIVERIDEWFEALIPDLRRQAGRAP